MATLPEVAQWIEGIYELTVDDHVMGGPDGIDNRQAKELAARTLYLKQAVEAVGAEFRNLFIGIPLPYPVAVPPTGCLIMQGQGILQAAYPSLYTMYGSTLLDLRGEFIRGWDNGRGVDIGRALLSFQADKTAVNGLLKILHRPRTTGFPTALNSGNNEWPLSLNLGANVADPLSSRQGMTGDNETSPRSIAYNYICLAG